MNRFEKMATLGVKSLNPYQPGKPIEELQREYGVTDVIKLASNENPLGTSPRVRNILSAECENFARYPDGNGFALKQMLAEKHNISMDCITLGNGSSDPLEFVVRVFAQPGDEVLFSEHAFAMYPIVTQAASAIAVVSPSKDWGHDLDEMASRITERTRVIFIANPNNPTGTRLNGEELEAFIARVPESVIVVVDEAYFEYASEPALAASDYTDATQLTMKWLDPGGRSTLCKAYGLAGLRVGYSLSHPDLANLLNRIRPPFNVNSLALAAACASLEDSNHVAKAVALNAQEMGRMTKAFEHMGLDYIPSVGNFVCVDVSNSEGRDGLAVYERLLHEGIIVRPVANYGMPGFLRVTLGLPEENAKFLNALGKVL